MEISLGVILFFPLPSEPVSPGLSTPPSARKGTTTADENENSIAHWLSHRNFPLLDPYIAFFQTNLTGKLTSP